VIGNSRLRALLSLGGVLAMFTFGLCQIGSVGCAGFAPVWHVCWVHCASFAILSCQVLVQSDMRRLSHCEKAGCATILPSSALALTLVDLM
jgi:hypothetical protein